MLGAFTEIFDEDQGQEQSPGKIKQPPNPRCDTSFVGLDNQGATCYLNSLLQALYMTPELRSGLFSIDPEELGIQPLQQDNKGKKKKPRVIPLELQRLFSQLQLQNQDAISTEDLTTKGFQWESYDGRVQQDVHELIRLLFDALEMALSNTSGSGLVSSLYQGTVVYQTHCLTCKAISEREERFYDILLQVKGCVDIISSLLNYTQAEKLEGRNQYWCDNCDRKVDALRMQQLRNIPPIVIFSLNRFEYDTTTYQRVKVNDKFSFPLSLDMSDFQEEFQRESKVAEMSSEERERMEAQLKSKPLWVPDAWKACAEALSHSLPLTAEVEKNQDEVLKDSIPPPEKGLDAVLSSASPTTTYDLMAIIIHRGSAYSGHYHALIRDFTGQGKWTPPSQGNMNGPCLKTSQSIKNAVKHNKFSPLPHLLRILSKQPISKQFGAKCIKIGALFEEIKKASNGKTWNNKFKSKFGSLESFVSSHEDCFLLDKVTKTVWLTQEGDNAAAELEAEKKQMKEDQKLAEKLQEDLFSPASDHAPSTNDNPERSKHASGQGEWTVVKTKKNRQHTENEEEKDSLDDIVKKLVAMGFSESGAKKAVTIENSTFEACMEWALAHSEDPNFNEPLPEMETEATATAPPLVSEGGLPEPEHEQKGKQEQVEWKAADDFGRWFNFDDRRVYPVSLQDLENTFEGKDSAYLLMYRQRALSDVSHENGYHLPSPPNHWKELVLQENARLEEARANYDADCHKLRCVIHFPVEFSYVWPHLILSEQTNNSLSSKGMQNGLVLEVDDRLTVTKLKQIIVEQVEDISWMIGVPPVADLNRLHELRTHGPGFYMHHSIAENDDAVLSNIIQSDAQLFFWDGEQVNGIMVPPGTPEAAPISFSLTVLGPGEKKNSMVTVPTNPKKKTPLVDIVLQGHILHIPRNSNSQVLGEKVAEAVGCDGTSILCHFVVTNSSGEQVVPAFSSLKDAAGIKLISEVKLVDGAEILVEQALGTDVCLARLEIKRRNSRVTVKLENAVKANPSADDGEEMLASLGLNEEGDTTDCNGDDLIVIKVDPETTISELKVIGLQKYGLSLDDYFSQVVLRRPFIKGGDVFGNDSLDLISAGVISGERLILGMQGASAASSDLFTIRFIPVEGNDSSAKYNPLKRGTYLPELQVEVDSSCTVIQLKRLMCEKAGIEWDGHKRRIRLVQWTTEPGALVPEINEEGKEAGTDVLVKNSGIISCQEPVLLEEGNVPLKGEITLQVYVWNPEPQQLLDLSSIPDVEHLTEAQAALEKLLEWRRQFLIQLSSIETNIESSFEDLKQILLEKVQTETDVQHGQCSNKQNMLVRELRDDILPGRVFKEGKASGALQPGMLSIGFSKVPLKKLKITGQKPLVLHFVDDITLKRYQAANAITIWSQEWKQVSEDAEPSFKETPYWPPVEVFIDGGASPSLGHLHAALAQRFDIPVDSIGCARHQFALFKWATLHPNMTSQSKGKKRKPAAKSIKDAPYLVLDGEHIMAMKVNSSSEQNSCIETNIDQIGKMLLENRRCISKMSKTKSTLPEVALKLGKYPEFSDSDDNS